MTDKLSIDIWYQNWRKANSLHKVGGLSILFPWELYEAGYHSVSISSIIAGNLLESDIKDCNEAMGFPVVRVNIFKLWTNTEEEADKVAMYMRLRHG